MELYRNAHTVSWLLTLILTVFSTTAFSVSTSAALPTCPFRTVNHITHSLPQQCLATSRSSNTTISSNATSPVAKLSSSASVTSVHEGYLCHNTSASAITVTSSASLSSPTNFGQIDDPRDGALATKATEAPDALEEDSAFESGNFLSFEEWKKQNLKKAGQSEHIARRNQEDSSEPRKRPAGVQNSLDTLGDDMEIDIDFSGFVPGGPEAPKEASQPIANTPSGTDGDNGNGSPRPKARSKDAGTTCKERFNYASFDCAANVLKTNKEAKSPNAVLAENKDYYMLNQCTAQNKFIILELCNDILIDTVVLANFEFFSSTFRTFQVSVSDRYPVKVDKWKILGTYEARNTREVQAFLIENPLIWSRYLRIEFLSHYGNEFYCPVSLVRIHGTTMMEDYKHDLEQALEEDSYESSEQQIEPESLVDSLTPEAIAEPLKMATAAQDTQVTEVVDDVLVETTTASTDQLRVEFETVGRGESAVIPASIAAIEAIASVIGPSDTCVLSDSPSPTASTSAGSHPASSSHVAQTPDTGSTASGRSTATVVTESTLVEQSTSTPIRASGATENTTRSDSSRATTQSSISMPGSQFSATSASLGNSTSVTTTGKEKVSSSASERPKSSSSAVQPHPAVPTMQESFFKSVQKRLQMLEANSSLSLQYIEDQSRALREAFKKVEQKQLARTTTFLDHLNSTMLNELREFRQQYDQLWQSTVIELETQRERYERDNEAINARLGILADEIIFQRRMTILQMILILVCLVLVLFSRGAINNYLELPIVQNVLSKSPNSKWLTLSGVDSLVRPQPNRVRSAHDVRTERPSTLKGHRRMQLEDSITDAQDGTEMYAPPTPVSEYGHSEVELLREEGKDLVTDSEQDINTFGDPEFDPSTIERPSTSPPVLRVNDGLPVLDLFETSEEETMDERLRDTSNSLPNGDVTPQVLLEAGATATKRLSWKLPER